MCNLFFKRQIKSSDLNFKAIKHVLKPLKFESFALQMSKQTAP